MAFLVEDGTGLSASNSYLSVADFKTYHSDRGADFSAYSELDIQNALVQATDYIDRRYPYKGYRSQGRDQALEWPRNSVVDPDGYTVDSDSVPNEVEWACSDLALTALDQLLIPNLAFDSSGGFVTEQSSAVGSVKSTIKYSTLQGRKQFAEYPNSDALLRRFVRFEKQLVRAS